MDAEQQVGVQAAADAAAAVGRLRQLDMEANLPAFLEENGVEVYSPDLAAFRNHVQAQYVDSEFAASWPDGVLEQINALGN
jgi:TRAP-type C4-dicarboxylate transport system substrate-binding protein